MRIAKRTKYWENDRVKKIGEIIESVWVGKCVEWEGSDNMESYRMISDWQWSINKLLEEFNGSSSIWGSKGRVDVSIQDPASGQKMDGR